MTAQPSIQRRLLSLLRSNPEFRRLWAERAAWSSGIMDPDDPLPEGSRLERLRGSWAMRARGCWSWSAIGPSNELYPVGSHYPMTALLRADSIHVSLFSVRAGGTDDIEIDPGTEPEPAP